MEVCKGIKLEEKEIDYFPNSGVKVKEECGESIGCSDLHDEIKRANEKYATLELNIGKKNSVIETLEGRVGIMEVAKLEIVDEVKKLKQRNEELEKSIRDSEEEREKFTLLMIENEVLGCEKKKAETDVEFWKLKCKELEARVMDLESRLADGTTKAGLDLHESETKDTAKHGTPPSSTPFKHCADVDGINGGQKSGIKSTVRKCLDFAVGSSSLQKFSPSTPGSRPPLEPIYLSDSDDDLKIVRVAPDGDSKEQRKAQMSNGVALKSADVVEFPLKNTHEPIAEHQSNGEEASCSSSAGQSFRKPKRRKVRNGVAQIVTSESESDDDIPISALRSIKACSPDTQSQETLRKLTPMRRLQRLGDTKDSSVLGKCSQRSSVNQSNFGKSENMNDPVLEDEIEGDEPVSPETQSKENLRKVTPRRRLRKLGDTEDTSVLGKRSLRSSRNQSNLGKSENMNDTLLEDESEADESSSEGESLGGFIVESTDVSDCDSGSNCNDVSGNDGSLSGDCSDESESASEGNIRYDEIISGLRRERKDKLKWEYESDMLADFGKSSELCMKAICALYRQQTSEEKSSKATIHRNGRGFNQIHAFSGSALAEFLTDGDPHADVNKTVEELQSFNPKGVEQCRKLATYYSKQLFEIYKNGEDPFFHP